MIVKISLHYQKLSDFENFEMKMIGIIRVKLMKFIVDYINRNKTKKYSTSVAKCTQDLFQRKFSALPAELSWQVRIEDKFHKVLDFKSFKR